MLSTMPEHRPHPNQGDTEYPHRHIKMAVPASDRQLRSNNVKNEKQNISDSPSNDKKDKKKRKHSSQSEEPTRDRKARHQQDLEDWEAIKRQQEEDEQRLIFELERQMMQERELKAAESSPKGPPRFGMSLQKKRSLEIGETIINEEGEEELERVLEEEEEEGIEDQVEAERKRMEKLES